MGCPTGPTPDPHLQVFSPQQTYTHCIYFYWAHTQPTPKFSPHPTHFQTCSRISLHSAPNNFTHMFVCSLCSKPVKDDKKLNFILQVLLYFFFHLLLLSKFAKHITKSAIYTYAQGYISQFTLRFILLYYSHFLPLYKLV